MKWVWVIGVCGAMCGGAAVLALGAEAVRDEPKKVEKEAQGDNELARKLIGEDLSKDEQRRLVGAARQRSDRGWGLVTALMEYFWMEDPVASVTGNPGRITRERERARLAVWHIAGAERHDALIRLGPAPAAEAVARVGSGEHHRDVASVDVVSALLRSPDPGLRRDGATELLGYLRERGGTALLHLKSDMIDILGAAWDAEADDPAGRALILKHISGLDRPVQLRRMGIGVLLRAVRDKDAEIASRAKALAEKWIDARTAPLLVDIGVEDSGARPYVLDELLTFSRSAMRLALERAQWWVAQRGKASWAWTLIEKLGGQDDRMTKLALEIAKFEPVDRKKLADLISSPHRADILLAPWLSDKKAQRREAGARLLLAGIGVFDAAKALQDAIRSAGDDGRSAVMETVASDRMRAALMAQSKIEDDQKVRRGSAMLARVVAEHDEKLRKELEALLRADEDTVRKWAALALDSSEGRRVAQTMEVIRDLKSEQPEARMSAARRVETLGLVPPRVAAALVRATDGRNMAVRQGIVMAIENAYASSRPVEEVLKELAEAQDPTTRACARAALREIAEK